MNNYLSCFLLLSVVMLGCGNGRPQLSKAKGRVTLDGQPLDGAQIALQPIVTGSTSTYQRPSFAFTDDAGHFIPETYGGQDGLPRGKYRVAVIKKEVVGKLPPGYDETQPDLFNVKYRWITPRSVSDPEGSGLEIEVTSSGMRPDVIELKSSPVPEFEMTGPRAKSNEP